MRALASLLLTAFTLPSQAPDAVRHYGLVHTDTEFAVEAPADAAAWQMRAKWLRGQIRWAAGLLPEPDRTPLRPTVTGTVEGDGFTVENVAFESRPGLFVCGNLYRPAGGNGPFPAVLCPHGHWQQGRLHHDERGSVVARCVTLARRGMVVFSWDMLGYADSARQFGHRDPEWTRPAHGLWGFGPFAAQTWNSVRSLDYVAALPDVDATRIAVTGASGGGTQSFVLAAIDARIAVSAPVCMVSTIMQGGCSCENAPGLRFGTHNAEIAALTAPRPQMLVSATGDWTRKNPDVEFPYLRAIYGLLDAAPRLHHFHQDAPHNYNRASRRAVYGFLHRELLGSPWPGADDAPAAALPNPDELRVWPDGPPSGMASVAALAAREREAVRARLAENPATDSDVRAALGFAIGGAWPDAAPARNGDRGDLVRDGRSVAFPRGTIPAHVELRIAASPDTADAREPEILVPVFGSTPRPADSERAQHRYFGTFHRTDHAEAVFDAVTALAYALHAGHAETVTVRGDGPAGPIALAACALAPPARAARLHVKVDLAAFRDDSDASYLAHLNLPNLRRVGGVKALERVVRVCAASVEIAR